MFKNRYIRFLLGILALFSSMECARDPSESDRSPPATVDGATIPSGPLPGFRVLGRDLYDRCGTKVVLRGINEMVVWSPGKDGDPEFAEISKTGANVVRIVWAVAGSAAELDKAIGNAVAQTMIPMIELHDATGDNTKIMAMVDWWVKPEVVAVVKKWEQVLLVNIANEAGTGNVAESTFESDYQTAIIRMRTAGYRVPLIIDGSSWGQNLNILLNTGPTLIAADPDHNILLSVHMWWNDPSGSRVTQGIQDIITTNLPIIVGEFAHHAAYQCTAAPFAYKIFMELAQTHGISWLAWSWGSVKNSDCATDGPFDMSSDGTFEGLTGWGLEVAVTDPHSIKNTSVRPASIVKGTCD